MRKFRKRKKILFIGGIFFILVSGTGFCLKPSEENKAQETKRELIAMFVQDEDGEYQVNTFKGFPKNGYILNLEKSACKNGGVLSQDSMTKKISLRTSHADQCTLYFDKIIPKTAKEALELLNLKINEINPADFAIPATTDETASGLFGMQDDYGMSYYYRGTAPNNYVKFGQNADGKDMWWRIIRFNGDGTVRMQYDGTGSAGTNTYTRGFALTNVQWNSGHNDAKSVGWMFGGQNKIASTSREEAQRNETDSPVKTEVDVWYKKNIVETGYGKYVADSIFCNDRSFESRNKGLGYGSSETYFGVRGRTGVSSGPTEPQFTCPQENDKFTVEETSKGNGASTYPVGLITADEIVAAGSGKHNATNRSYYLYKGNWYWSFSPSDLDSYGYASVFNVYSSGQLYHRYVNGGGAVAPVINLKTGYLDKLRGEGTIDNPYFLEV